MEINSVLIDDTFAEAFPIKMARVQITAVTERWAQEAAREATGFGTSVIGCPAEAGIECFVDGRETVDGRPGVNILICNMGLKNLENSLLMRLGQCVLTAPTAAAYSGMDDAETQFDTGRKLSFFGDGYQKSEERFGRKIWKIPLMSGDFIIENSFGAVEGIAGGNFLIQGQNQMSALTAAEVAIDSIRKVEGAITPFPGGVVSSGSKVGSKYKGLKASTNSAFCASLREDGVCVLAEDVSCVFEIVINGVDREAIESAMRAGIHAACQVPGVLRITAANYEGKLGIHRFHLHHVLE
ncbi:MAG TPA: formylmethanofuran--tetrahydromethanopterin N-formyltransferase [Methanothrix sp.]|uniref:formylmethanofuran--tetrahydromethanopterin N-formyltransferase n=1 Tax=Methanothrix sp. TaxID=90426 RepID=UPI002CF345F2|nr:formylmethanofuran--tetrahydromethanopterin N-formyltransferase [Methanothrix sp.]MDI9417661.1 formylmethanofuran--tetrahydromethanopterin N-formyltransferase [Euryarchaeota archaeon]HON34827.1 formylmethanofuran--tetrahydromethanopterin N-formyltransferase [Methanothrix sp.]HRU75426.1 formylmethanofuran--tetrahydromethanopterin N-formyltransferase [Methanothrix sp.]